MTWLLICGMTAITFGNRYAFFARYIRYHPSPRFRKFLNYSSYAILTSIWTPIVFGFSESGGFEHAGVDYLLASALAAILAIMRVPSIVVVLLSTALFFGIRFFV